MRKRNTAPSPRTGDSMPVRPWRELSPLRPRKHSSVLAPVPIRVHGALPGDHAGSLTAAARWDAHGPVDTTPAPGRHTTGAVQDIQCRCCSRPEV
jgi:hypothetical protein